MADILARPEPTNQTEYEAALNEIISEIQRLREQMDADEADIQRLKAETRLLSESTRAKLNALKAMVS